MRAFTYVLVCFLLPLALSATTFPSLNLLPNVTNTLDAPDPPLNVSGLPPPEPFSATYGDLIIVLSNYGTPIPLVFFIGMYVRCLWQIWSVVAHSPNEYQPPETRPLDGPVFEYQNEIFHLELRQASSAVADWEYEELYHALNIIIRFATKYGMREMDVEVLAAGVGAFGETISYVGPPEASQ